MNTLSELKKEGITLFLVGDSLKFKAKRGITPAQRERIRRDREEIIRLIRQEGIPTATDEQTDIFRAVLIQVETGRVASPLWPKVSRYLKRKLPLHLFTALEELAQDQGDTTPREEWQSPYPSRCFDCTRRDGCRRVEKVQWGLLCRHDCRGYEEMKA